MSVRRVVKTVLGAAVGVAASIGAILAFRKKKETGGEPVRSRSANRPEPSPMSPAQSAQRRADDTPAPQPASAAPVADAAAPQEPAAQEPAVPETAPEPAVATTIKGVAVADGAAFVDAVNAADEAALKAAGLKGRVLKLVLDGRPFASADALGSTAGIGPKTIEALAGLASG